MFGVREGLHFHLSNIVTISHETTSWGCGPFMHTLPNQLTDRPRGADGFFISSHNGAQDVPSRSSFSSGSCRPSGFEKRGT